MKSESNLQPKNKFEIENIVDGKCDIVFYDNVEEITVLEDEENRYSYDIYRLKTNYRDNLEKELNDNKVKFNAWLELAKIKEYNKLALEIRGLRDKLLDATDKFTIVDYPISEIDKQKVLEYRQKLRDLPEQKGFPYDIKWPEKPNVEQVQTMEI